MPAPYPPPTAFNVPVLEEETVSVVPFGAERPSLQKPLFSVFELYNVIFTVVLFVK